MASKPQSSTKPTMQNKNVAGGQLSLFSQDPPVGVFRDGYCRTDSSDSGNHSIAATVNQAFLDFTEKKGNNLTKAGVKDGMKWCLCASRWKEAFDAAAKGQLSQSAVPKVHLHASHEKALDVVGYGDLKKYAAEPEAANQRNRQRSHIDPESTGSSQGIAKEGSDISAHGSTTQDLGKGEKENFKRLNR